MAATIAGRVADRDGRPVAGAIVFVVSAPVPLPDIARVAGPDGGFDVDSPAAGRYVIGASAPDGRRGEVHVEVGEGDPAPVTITLSG